MTTFDEVKEMLEMLREDQDAPRSLKERIDEMIKIVDSDRESQLKKDSLQQLLEEVSNDANLPSFVRTQVWSVSSALETVN